MTTQVASASDVPVDQLPAALLLDPGQTARLLNVRKSWVYEAVRDGRLPHIKVGRHLRFRRGDIEGWIETQHVDGRI